ncbi:low molecular weight protein-tyrosine-phosphatase [Spongiimicrobium salis]|uniref:low molecular weight protein-tyrosine-phosphatase n=1 Tax=Spongiimicrobium salis TaxID=1667022 RepID=UPI00374CFF80
MSTKILMVCLGNICRSPLAEGILSSKVDPEDIEVDSAGTAGYHIGKAPDHRSIAVAKRYGIDISKQRCRQFSQEDFNNFDIIYAMDRSNYHNILTLAKDKGDIEKVKLLLEVTALGITEVPDPYYDQDEGFEKVFHMIDIACDSIAKQLKTD